MLLGMTGLPNQTIEPTGLSGRPWRNATAPAAHRQVVGQRGNDDLQRQRFRVGARCSNAGAHGRGFGTSYCFQRSLRVCALSVAVFASRVCLRCKESASTRAGRWVPSNLPVQRSALVAPPLSGYSCSGLGHGSWNPGTAQMRRHLTVESINGTTT